MQILTLEVRPSRTTVGNVDIVSPYTQQVLQTGTVSAIITYLRTTWGVPTGAATRYVERGREIRTLWAGVRSFAREEVTPI